MSTEGIIRQEAREIATQLQRSAPRLEREYADLQAKAAEIKAKRDLARTAADRVFNFAVKRGGDYCCPACWIKRNALGLLMPRPSQTRDDIFECANCGHTIAIAY